MQNFQGNKGKGKERAFTSCSIINGRIAGKPKYYPAYVKANGTVVQQRVEVPLYANVDPDADPHRFEVTVWGPAADSIARFGSMGKKLHVVRGELNTHMKFLFNTDRTPRVDAAGQHIQIKRVGITVREFTFGEDSQNFINQSIAIYESSGGRAGRPRYWNVPDHPDKARWDEIWQTMKGQVWDGQSKQFMFAEVRQPKGEGIRVLTPAELVQYYDKRRQNGGANDVATAQHNMPAMQYNQNLPGQVANALPPAPQNPAPQQNAWQGPQNPAPQQPQGGAPGYTPNQQAAENNMPAMTGGYGV